MFKSTLNKLLALIPVSAFLFTGACGGIEDEAALEQTEDEIVIGPLVANKLVYSIQSGAIHVRNATTGTDVVLPVSGRYASMNPARTKIVYVTTAGRVAVCNPDGSGNVLLTGTGYTMPSWSQNSEQITFASQGTAGYGADIYVINADGTGLLRLTDNPGTWYFTPRFLTDTAVVFQQGHNGSATFNITAATVANQTAFFKLGGISGGGALDVSPDGTKVVYQKLNGSCGNSSLMIADVQHGFLTSTTVNHVELYCNGATHRDANSPSFGAYGVIGFERGNGTGISYAGRDLMTITKSGNDLTNHLSTTSPVDTAVR